MKNFASIMLITILILAGIADSDADDIDLFLAQIPPDALMILDLSGSMKWTAAGSTMYVSGTSCTIDGPFYPKSGEAHTFACSNLSQTGGPIYGDSSCTGPFYKTSGTGHDTNCSRLAIARDPSLIYWTIPMMVWLQSLTKPAWG